MWYSNRRIRIVLLLLLLNACSGGQKEESVSTSREEPLDQAIAKGAELFRRNGCIVCHGVTGKGDGSIAHTLKKMPRNLHDSTSYQRGPSIAQIEETIRQGIGTGVGSMVGYPHIKPENRRRIAQFIHSLQKVK